MTAGVRDGTHHSAQWCGGCVDASAAYLLTQVPLPARALPVHHRKPIQMENCTVRIPIVRSLSIPFKCSVLIVTGKANSSDLSDREVLPPQGPI